MDFASWSPSHTILAAFALVAFIGQVAVLFYRTGALEKRIIEQNDAMHKQSQTLIHAIERLDDRMEKRFAEVDKRFTEVIGTMNHQISDVRTEIGKLRAEMNQRLSDVATEISKLNQNHVDHLTHHQSGQGEG